MNNTRKDVENLYTLYDKVAERYAPVFTATNDATAMRSIAKLFHSQPTANMSDYMLYHVGDFDPLDGCLGGSEVPRLVVDYSLTKEITEK